MAVERMDEPAETTGRRRADRRLHLVRAGRHEGLGHGFDQTPGNSQPGRPLHAQPHAKEGRKGISPAGRGIFDASDQQH